MIKNKLVLLREDNIILKVLGQFRNKFLANQFIEENYPEFEKDICQFSNPEQSQFITIE